MCLASAALVGLAYCIMVFARSTDSNKWMHLGLLLIVVAYCATQYKEFVSSNNALDAKIAEMTTNYE